MTKRSLKRNKISKLNRADIWGSIFIHKKLTKFAKIKQRRRSNKISIGNFKGDIRKRPKSTRRRKTRYGRNLKLKQRLINFYGSMKNFQFKKHLLREKKHQNPTFLHFISKLERRLDIILFRANFILTVFQARQLINHNKVLLNNKLVSKPNILLKIQDILHIDQHKFTNNIIKKVPFVFNYCAKYLFINYKTLDIGVHNIPKLKFLSFPFKFKIRRFLEIYKT